MSRLDLRGESGFTLVELMVAGAAGLIVSTATLAIVIVSVHFSSNYADRVDATQQGRIAMQKVTQLLNSSCVSTSVAPILATSDANNLWFYSALSDSPTITPSEEQVTYTNGTLVIDTYANTGGTGPSTWTFSSTASSQLVLLPHASQVGTTPIFQYFGYGSGGAMSMTPDTLSSTLGATNAATAAEVQINFQARPTDNSTALGRPASFSDAIVLRLSPSSSSTSNLPCS
jgi:Tfp pilus assembly protein PilW